MKTKTYNSRYFYGHEISPYGLENGYLDYRTLSEAFDAVMVNDITKLFYNNIGGEYCEPEQINGLIDNSDEISKLENEISELELKLNNKHICKDDVNMRISELRECIDELEQQQENPPEVFQWFIVSSYGAEIIQEFTDDPLYYLEPLDMYVWGVTHWGTSWDYVLTDCKLELNE